MRIQQVGLGWVRDSAGGLERYQDGLCRALAYAGHEVCALVESRRPVGSGEPYKVKAFATQADPRSLRHRKLHCVLRCVEPYDVFVTHHASLGPGFLAAAESAPHVVQFHGPWAAESRFEGRPRWVTWMQRRLERRVYTTGDRLITLSHAFADVLQRDYRIEADRIRVIPGGVDSEAFDPEETRYEARRRLGWPTSRPVVFCLRRLTRRMGLLLLLDAARQMKEQGLDFLLLIGGRGPMERELTAKIEAMCLGDQVQLLGYVADDDLPLAYRAADLSVVPTQSLEGFGLIVLESLAAGTPVVVTPVGGLPEVVSNLSTSLVADSASSPLLAAALSEALSGVRPLPDKSTCQRYVRRNFDWQVIADRVVGVYQEAIRANG